MTDPLAAVSTTFLLASAGFALWLHRFRAVCAISSAEAGAVLYSGLLTTVLMAGHLIGVIAARVNGAWSPVRPGDVFWVFGFPYDFRFYSLAAFAVVVLAQGVTCLRVAIPLARDEASARPAALRATAVTFAFILPLWRIAHYAPVLLIPTGLAGLALALGARRARFRQRLGPVVATVR